MAKPPLEHQRPRRHWHSRRRHFRLVDLRYGLQTGIEQFVQREFAEVFAPQFSGHKAGQLVPRHAPFIFGDGVWIYAFAACCTLHGIGIEAKTRPVLTGAGGFGIDLEADADGGDDLDPIPGHGAHSHAAREHLLVLLSLGFRGVIFQLFIRSVVAGGADSLRLGVQADNAGDLLVGLNEMHTRPEYLLEGGKGAGHNGTRRIDPQQARTPFFAFAGPFHLAAVLHKYGRPVPVSRMQLQPAEDLPAIVQRASGQDELCIKEHAGLIQNRQDQEIKKHSRDVEPDAPALHHVVDVNAGEHHRQHSAAEGRPVSKWDLVHRYDCIRKGKIGQLPVQ